MAGTAAKVVIGVIGGTVAGLFIGGFAFGVLGFLRVKQADYDQRHGWVLAPVVVAARDLAPGTVVTFDDLSQRSIPDLMVTPSMVKPDLAESIVNRHLRVPLREGDPLWAALFEPRVPNLDLDLATECTEAIADSHLATRPATSVAELRAQVLAK